MIKASELKAQVKAGDRRISKEAIEAVDKAVIQLIDKIIKQKDGNKKTIDATLVNFVLGTETKKD